ncbi:MAG: hypothetical protein O6941_00340 [Planctomycetota bacterium]|nr:hypothetical protein [Planctomycetota bacterium]
MVGVDAASEDQHLAASATAGAALSLGQFAHELDSLLDGSLRCVGPALRLFEQFDDGGAALAGEPISAKLRTAQDAMTPTAELPDRVMCCNDATVHLQHRTQPIDQEVPVSRFFHR